MTQRAQTKSVGNERESRVLHLQGARPQFYNALKICVHLRDLRFQLRFLGSMLQRLLRECLLPKHGSARHPGMPTRGDAPIHHVPKRRHIVGPAILIMEVIGVLPHIETDERASPVHER